MFVRQDRAADLLPQPLTPGQVRLLALASLSASFCSPLAPTIRPLQPPVNEMWRAAAQTAVRPLISPRGYWICAGRPTGEQRRGCAGGRGRGASWREPSAQEAAPELQASRARLSGVGPGMFFLLAAPSSSPSRRLNKPHIHRARTRVHPGLLVLHPRRAWLQRAPRAVALSRRPRPGASSHLLPSLPSCSPSFPRSLPGGRGLY